MKRSKYNAIRTTVDNIVFDSKHESVIYGRLKLCLRLGSIEHLTFQPEFELHAPSGEVIGRYFADFAYNEIHDDGSRTAIVLDAKGFKTPLYRWKKRHVEAEYVIKITEV